MSREDLDEIIESLEQTPTEVSLLLDQISPHEQRIKNADEFSALENICHLRDIEIEGYSQRIAKIINEDNPSLPDLDGARLAIERDYNNQDGRAALAAFNDARGRNLELLKNLSVEQIAREGKLEGVGIISLERLIEMMLEHDQGHLEELMTLTRRSQARSGTTAV